MKFNDRVRFMDEEFERLWARVSDMNRWFDEHKQSLNEETERLRQKKLWQDEQQRRSMWRRIVDPVLIGPVLVATTVAIAVNLLINVWINH